MNLKTSRTIALFAGPVLPVLETIRRIRIGGHFVWWLDDYLIGIALFTAGLLAGRDPEKGRPFLSVAWGLACGMGYVSFFSHLLSPRAQSERFNGPVTLVVGLGMLLALWGLAGSLRASAMPKPARYPRGHP